MNLIPTAINTWRSNFLFLVAVLWSSSAPANDLPELDRSIFGEALQTASQMPRLHSLLISHNGEIILEEYFNGQSARRTANVKSVSKSFMSALVGIAIENGHVAGLDQPIGEFYGDRLNGDTARSAITIGNLLSMQAGLETTSFYNYGAWVLSDDWVDFALAQPVLSPPGTRMLYSTGNTHLLSDILTRTTGKTTLEFARQQLGRPLGIQIAAWPQDPDGVYFGGNNMEFTPRQMLAFGELYINGGVANGQQIISPSWIEQSLTPVVQ